jgi:hypothetical protein
MRDNLYNLSIDIPIFKDDCLTRHLSGYKVEVNGFKFITFICMEAQELFNIYFNNEDVDFRVWSGHWGWSKNDTWKAIKNDGGCCLVYSNMLKWQRPLIQTNFAYNDSLDFRGNGPHGVSMIVNSDNSHFNNGAIDQESCEYSVLANPCNTKENVFQNYAQESILLAIASFVVIN